MSIVMSIVLTIIAILVFLFLWAVWTGARKDKHVKSLAFKLYEIEEYGMAVGLLNMSPKEVVSNYHAIVLLANDKLANDIVGSK